MDDWSSWIQGIGTTAANVYQAKETAKYQAQAVALQEAAKAGSVPATAGLSPMLLLGGLALVAILVLKD